MRAIAFGVTTVGALLMLCNHAEAQSAWKAVCNPDPMTDARRCATAKTVWPAVERPYLMLAYAYTEGIVGVLAREPGKRVRVRVDKEPVISTTWCGRSGCELDLANSTLILAHLKQGKTVLVEYLTINDEIIGPYEFSAEGFVGEFEKGRAMASQ